MKTKRSYFLFGILFILSGVASLIYQTAWFKQLSYFMGNGTYAQSVVLGTFMGGLALGAWFFGKKADQVKNTFKLFALLEIGIGLYCFFYDPIFDGTKQLFTEIVVTNELPSDSFSVLVLKALFSAIAMLIPTVLMGGTLPVLVRCISAVLKDVGPNVAILYFINSFGAVIGSVVGGFYLINAFGISLTTKLAAGTDFFVGIVFLLIAKKQIVNIAIKEKEIEDVSSVENRRLNSILLLVAFSSGACAMIYEMIWLRLLIPILSSTTYSFTIVVTAFITGITIGSLLVFLYFKRLKNQGFWIAICQFGIIASTCLSLLWYERVPYLIWSNIDPSVGEANYSSYLLLQFTFSFALLLLPTIFMGMSLPLISKLITTSVNNSGKSIGTVFGINTLGSVLGSFIGGLFLIPTFGIKGSIDITLCIGLITGIICLIKLAKTTKSNKTITISLLGLVALVYFNGVQPKRWVHSVMLSEISRSIHLEKTPKSFKQFLKETRVKKGKIQHYNEGLSGTVVVGKRENEVYLYTNGKGDANSVSDLQTQSSLGHTSILLHPKPDSVFVIGFGAGHTIGSVMTHPDVKFAQVAEISPEVIEASKHFNHVNEKPLEKPNLEVIKDDGLAALRLSPHRYDVIISQPSNPWSAGVGNLFTKEFFRDCKRKLRPGGIVAQWFNLYEMDDHCLQLVVRTIRSEFDHVSVWKIGQHDVLFLCSEKNFQRDLNKMKERFERVQAFTSKQNISIHSFSAFLSQQFQSSMEVLDDYAGTGPLNTEDRPLLELWAPKAYFYDVKPTKFKQFDAWHAYQNQSLLLNQHESEVGISHKDQIEISLFKSNGGGDGNDAFRKTLKQLVPSQTFKYRESVKGDPAHMEIGMMGIDQKISPLDSANTDQLLSSWTCCADYKSNNKITMLWKSPSGKVLSTSYEHSKDWITSWSGAPISSKDKEQGWWFIRAMSGGKTILADSIFIGDAIPKIARDFPHPNSRMIARVNGKTIPLNKVHPMQRAYLNTFGQSYGITEKTIIKWISPSGIESSQVFIYQANYNSAWIPKRGAIPMEEGAWSVEIENTEGKTLHQMSFIVDTSAKLIDN